MKFSSIQLYLRHAEQRCSQSSERKSPTTCLKKPLSLMISFISSVEASLREEESAVFVDVSSTQEGFLPPPVDKMPKSLKECSECNKSFKFVLVYLDLRG